MSPAGDSFKDGRNPVSMKLELSITRLVFTYRRRRSQVPDSFSFFSAV
jgi:hypothetical protein